MYMCIYVYIYIITPTSLKFHTDTQNSHTLKELPLPKKDAVGDSFRVPKELEVRRFKVFAHTQVKDLRFNKNQPGKHRKVPILLGKWWLAFKLMKVNS